MRLSPRQMEIISLVCCEGYTYPEAAKELGISPHTVRVHVKRIAERSGYENVPPRRALFMVWRHVPQGRQLTD